MKNKEKYLDELIQIIVSGCLLAVDEQTNRPGQCYKKVRCPDCLFYIMGCNSESRKEWLEQEYKEPIELTKFEYDLLDTNDQSHKRKIGSFQTYNHMRKHGYFKNVPFDESIEYVLANCEVKDEK